MSEAETHASFITEACKKLDKKHLVFRISSPMSLTLRTYNKDGSWGYKHQSFIGDEEFHLTDAYVGKSGKAICVLMQEGFKSLTVEIPYDKCHEKLIGFSNFLSLAFSLDDDEVMNEAKLDSEIKERQAHEEAQRARRIENPNFGSW